MEEYVKILKKHILFRDVGDADFPAVLKRLRAHVRHYGKNEIIHDTGEKVTEAGIVVKGSAYIFISDIKGSRMILRELKTGNSFGESADFAGINNPAAVVSITNCSVLFISLRQIMENSDYAIDALIRKNLVTLLAQVNIALLMKNDIISKRTIRERLMTYFYYHMSAAESSTVKTALTKEELADYLCVNRSAMSRELGKMLKEGVLTYTKDRFVINADPPPAGIE